eukprot:5625648-Amphidinium_carterae.1
MLVRIASNSRRHRCGGCLPSRTLNTSQASRTAGTHGCCAEDLAQKPGTYSRKYCELASDYGGGCSPTF